MSFRSRTLILKNLLLSVFILKDFYYDILLRCLLVVNNVSLGSWDQKKKLCETVTVNFIKKLFFRSNLRSLLVLGNQ